MLFLCNNYFVLHKIVYFLCNRLCESKKNQSAGPKSG